MMPRNSRSSRYTGEAEPPAADLGSGNDREEEAPSPDLHINEDIGLNSSERSTSDAITGHGSGSFLRFGTWNINTLYQAGKIDNCIAEMKAHKLDVLGVGEVRWTESGKITKQDTIFYYSGGEKHQNGVGIMLKKKYEGAVNGFWPVSDRVVMIRISGKPFDVVIIQVYAPTSTGHSDQEVEDYYEDIKKAIDQIKSTDILIVMGDKNAKIGKGKVDDTVGDFGLGDRNDRGDRLLQFCQEFNLMIANTFFEHPSRYLYTWKSPGDRCRNQIDYIMIKKRFRNNIKNVKTYPGADMGVNCDHNLLVARINIKLKTIKKTNTQNQLDYNMLKQEEVQTRYAVEVSNIYNALTIEEGVQEQSVEDKIERKFHILKESIHTASKNTLEKKKRKKPKEWMTGEIMELIEKRKQLKKPDQNEQTEEYNEMDKRIKDECRLAKDKWFNEECDEIMQLEKEHNIREMHNKVKNLTKKKKGAKAASSCIRDEEGKMLFTEDEIKKRWKEYVSKLYDDPNRPEAEEIVIEEEGRDFSIQEVIKAIKRMKNGKASGIDEIKTEHLKALNEDGLNKLTEICNEIYNTGYIPKELRHSLFITIPKKKNAQLCSEHRTISLMSHITKIILGIIIDRNRDKIDGEISDSQSGFRPGIGTREGIFNIRTIFDKMLALKKKVYACFIDYEKAFDRVYHSTLMKILSEINIHSKDRRIIQNLYWEQTASIVTETGTSEEFEVKRGVRQGCVLSPMLFNLYTEKIFKEDLNGVRMGGEQFSNLRYADDTVLIAESPKELQTLVDEVKNRSKLKGLSMNVKKTKTMVVRRNVKSRCKIEIKVEDKILEQVKQYLYLGHIITEDGRCDTEIRRRIEIARSNFMSMKNLLTSRTLRLSTRKKLIKCYVLSTFLYATETWAINQVMWDKIEAFEMWLWRKCMKISYTEHKTNQEVLKMVGEERSLSKEIITRKLRYFGHIIRKDGVQKRLLDAELVGNRGRGRPMTSWLGDIQKATGKKYEELVTMVVDRKLWRGFVSNLLVEEDTHR